MGSVGDCKFLDVIIGVIADECVAVMGVEIGDAKGIGFGERGPDL